MGVRRHEIEGIIGSLFLFRDNEDEQKLIGGLTESETADAIQASNWVLDEFNLARKEGDSVLVKAAKYGAKEAPVMKPLFVFKPLQTPVFVKHPKKLLEVTAGYFALSERDAIAKLGAGTYLLDHHDYCPLVTSSNLLFGHSIGSRVRLKDLPRLFFRGKLPGLFDGSLSVAARAMVSPDLIDLIKQNAAWPEHPAVIPLVKDHKLKGVNESELENAATRFTARVALFTHLTGRKKLAFSGPGVMPCMHLKDADVTGVVSDVETLTPHANASGNRGNAISVIRKFCKKLALRPKKKYEELFGEIMGSSK
ncbi:hypothetical protein AUJ65_00435 [Candidatus Micrarchaeota archaeon CG1_02_51_15]|nr:MAG: hypothetical protein AUJ65_00435 [Candidatus Micrarchaeota archaeon CG1_02_51_15]